MPLEAGDYGQIARFSIAVSLLGVLPLLNQ